MASIVIVGAGLAAWTTVREFRKLDSRTPVTVVTADSGDFYAKPSLSNAHVQGRTPAQLVTTPMAKMADAQQVQVQAGTRIASIDRAARTLTTERGTTLAYDRLVLATGAQPIRVPLQGDAADQVLAVNSLDDFAVLHARLSGAPAGRDRRRVLIMGAGLIGCEFANDLAASGMQVMVVDPSPGPVASLLPPEAGARLGEALSALGVTWHFGTTVASIDHAGATGGLAVTLSDGRVLGADTVLGAIGLRADTRLAQAAGLACERGILVDGFLQTSDPAIHALGDAAQYGVGDWNQAPVTGGRTLPYVMPIMAAAKALAATLAGQATPVVFPLMPVAIKTPALPIVVAAATPGMQLRWHSPEDGIWHQVDDQGRIRGFVLCGRQTSRRAELGKLIAA